MGSRRVVITGLGMLTPLGNSVAETWENILAGKSGITRLTDFNDAAFKSQIGGTIRNFDIAPYITQKEQKKMGAFMHYGVAAGIDAIADSGFQVTAKNAARCGIAIGSGIGGLAGIEEGTRTFDSNGARRISPFYIPANIINMIAGNLSIRYGMMGPNFAVTTACATGTHNIGIAAQCIQTNQADMMVAGGAEMAISTTGIAGFVAAKALSTRNDQPEQASRPWDLARDGFVLSEGAGVLVLEEYEAAKQRGANIYAELGGYGVSSDAYHITAPRPDGAAAALCMHNALADAKVNYDAVDYINAHGTSTRAGDIAETVAVKNVFKAHAYRLPISSTKSMIGHLLGAAGSVEAIFSVLAIRDQVAPPTINLDNQDPECDLDYIPHTARQLNIATVMSNSFGFGGTNATLLFQQLH